MSDRLLTAREVAEYLGLSPASVLRRWRVGEIPGFRLASNVVRFDPDEIERWLESRRGTRDIATRPLNPV
jgi:excisionase family DNA binding protein